MNKDLTECELALGCLYSVFIKKRGADGKLTKQAFLELLKEQLPSFTKGGNKTIGDEIFKGVDFNQDGAVDFKEFALMIAGIAAGSYETLQDLEKKAKK